MPKFFTDLNLDQVIEKIVSLSRYPNARDLFYLMPESRETMEMRRAVLDDVRKEENRRLLSLASDRLFEARALFKKAVGLELKAQEAVLMISSFSEYISALKLIAEIDAGSISSALKHCHSEVTKELSGAGFAGFENAVKMLCDELDNFSYKLIIRQDSYTIRTGDQKGKKSDDRKETYDIPALLSRCFPEKETEGFESPFAKRAGLSYLETEAYLALKREHPECIERCIETAEKYAAMINEDMFRLEKELQLYLSFLTFEDHMRERGFAFSVPSEGDGMRAAGIYDTALALRLMNQERPVIDNEVRLDKDEEFLVVTGPNQGGKTTFARAVGQLLYFFLMGLDVPAEEAVLPYFNNILTHFSVEESTETGQGKLKEELTRLAAMLKNDATGGFVILNELFTTAATLDAIEMGTRVMRYFSDCGCKGIYVTHIKELTESVHSVSMVAECDDSKEHRRLYKIVRRPAEGVGYADGITAKYGLTYEALTRRFEEAGLIRET